jgi:ribosomal protein S18 acetylase RimI-like enzyme
MFSLLFIAVPQYWGEAVDTPDCSARAGNGKGKTFRLAGAIQNLLARARPSTTASHGEVVANLSNVGRVPASLLGIRRGPWQVVPAAGFFFVEAMMTEKAAGSLSIRGCQAEDMDAVLALWRQAEATPSVTDTAADLRRALAGSQANVLVGEVGGQIVGSIIGTFDGWRGNIYRLAVRPDHRRRGIAHALVAEVERRLARQGARRITALVEKDHPLPMAFWEAVGYRLDQRLVRRVRNV